VTATVLALLWGALAAAPLLVAAARTRTRSRARALSSAIPSPRPHRRVRVPAVVARLARPLRDRRRRRQDADVLRRELPLALDLLQVAVTAGSTPYRAVELVARWGPPRTGDAFRAVLGATRVGRSLADALTTSAGTHPTLAPVVDVLGASDRLGAPAAPALTRLAQEVRADLRRRAEARARTLPVKLLFPLVFLVLPAFGLLTVVPALLGALART
jgi:tight adherence protein C